MKRISSKSKRRVLRLLTPPTAKTGIDFRAPRGLTVRRLIHHARYRRLRERATMILIEDDHHLCVRNLSRLGFDLCG